MASIREKRPTVLVCASAVGYYGDRGDEVLDEASPPGQGFLPEVCVEWEAEARRAEEFGVRVVHLRTGLVLSTDGGALAKMLPPFRLGIGGRLGSGNQWVSWIHISDVAGIVMHSIENESLRGPVNIVAPGIVRNAQFTHELLRPWTVLRFCPFLSLHLTLFLERWLNSCFPASA